MMAMSDDGERRADPAETQRLLDRASGSGHLSLLRAGRRRVVSVPVSRSSRWPHPRFEAGPAIGRMPNGTRAAASKSSATGALLALSARRATNRDRVVFHRSMDDALRSDEALAARLAADLDGSFEALVSAHAGRLFSIALRFLGDRSDAEEAAQDALVRAYRALAGYDEGRIRELRLRPWLATIVLNVCRNRTRVKRVRNGRARIRAGRRTGRRSGRPERREGELGGCSSRPCRRPSEPPSSSATSTACPTPRWPRPSADPKEPSRPRSTAAWPPCAMRSSPPNGVSGRR